MNAHRIVHIALHVESLGQAERFYARLFGLHAQDRAGSGRDPAPPLPHRPGAPETPAPDGPVTERVLGKGRFRLVLTCDGPVPVGAGRLAHICLSLSPSDLAEVRATAGSLGCRFLSAADNRLVLEDVYGVRWQVLTEPARPTSMPVSRTPSDVDSPRR